MNVGATDLLEALRAATLDKTPVSLGIRRTSSPHEFYRYPARFSPTFAVAAIEAFTGPGDLILDPFVGGGTTAVEAQRLGRRVIASDLNPLAVFVTRVKTSRLDADQSAQVKEWLDHARSVRLTTPAPNLEEWDRGGYFKDLQGSATWRLRKLITLMLEQLPPDTGAEDFARCVVLRAAQWALDMRTALPTVEELRSAVVSLGTDMLAIAADWSEHPRLHGASTILCQGACGLADALDGTVTPPRLVLTSPPYPGVYVNYHRWKMLGRREIKAPYWITNNLDGHGLAHYTMSARADRSLNAYFEHLTEAFTDLARLVTPETVVVQMVGFHNRDEQLPRFLAAICRAGLEEMTYEALATESDGRLWRSVPGRRWWTSAGTRQKVAPHTADEVVLFHRLAS